MSPPHIFRHSHGIVGFLLSLSITASFVPKVAEGQDFRTVRDAEIEFHLRSWSDPIFVAAGLEPSSVDLYLVSSSQINAFVTGGQNIFINTGTIVQAGSPDALLGVIAHEVGHIAGGHLARMRDAASNAQVSGIAASLIAIGATALGGGGGGEAVAAALSLGGNVAARTLLQHSRTNEHAADTAALRYLATVNRPSGPMIGLLSQLLKKEKLVENYDPYRRTHPLTQERIDQIRGLLEREGEFDAPPKPDEKIAYARMVAKIVAFTEPIERTLQVYERGQDTPSRYARAIAHYRKPSLKAALKEIDSLLAEHPEDPYFHELKGQMFFENGHTREAAESYQRAVELAPDSALLLIELAGANIETGDPSALKGTIADMERAVSLEPRNASAWRLLAQARGRSGDIALANLAQAENALLRQQEAEARDFAERALKDLPKDSPAAQRARDISELGGQDETR